MSMSGIFLSKASPVFDQQCLDGHWPKVNLHIGGGTRSYSLIDYSTTWAKFCTVANNDLKGRGYPQGIFSSRLRSSKFVADVEDAVSKVTPEAMNALPGRLKTMFD